MDFKMFNKDGNILPQGNTTANPDEGFMKELLNAEIDKKQNYAFPQKVYEAIDERFGENSLDNYSSDTENKLTEKQDRGELSDNRRIREGAAKATEISGADRGGHSSHSGTAQESKSWKNLNTAERKRIVRIVDGHIAGSRNYEEFLDLLSRMVGTTADEINASLLKKAIRQISEKIFADATTMHPVIFENRWAMFGDSASKLRKDILETLQKKSSAGDVYSSQETDLDGNTMSDRAKEILANAKPKMIGKTEKADIEFDRVRELFNELNADKDIQALADRVFEVAKKDVYGHYGYVSYPGEPKSHLRLPMAFVGNRAIPEGVHGQFRKNTIWGDIVFSYDYFMDESVAPQSKASTILHEVIHAVTCSHIESAYRWSQAKQGMFGDPLAATDFNGVDERIKAGMELIDAFEQVRSAPTKDGKNLYGQLTAYEMVAEMANVEFRNFLKKQNLWGRIVDAIKRIFGIPKTTAYDAVSDALERILTETTSDADTQRAKIEARKANNRYSSHETDDISNRHLLANAFEGLSRSSAEYQMIQDYKEQIKVLNLLDEQLSDLNAEIREIRFTKGKYDAEKLRKLEEKAERIARDIDKQDKVLIRMEASEPLRKIIAFERKKAAQKAKDHVKEIQQNKKVRAEQTELRHKIRNRGKRVAVHRKRKTISPTRQMRHPNSDAASPARLQAREVHFPGRIMYRCSTRKK